MTHATVHAPQIAEVFADPATLLSEMLAGLPRADQRRAAADYIGGLVGGSGRRTVRSMADSTGASAQTLQQFVGQSTWDVSTMSRKVARLVASHGDVGAWVIADTHFEKAGSHSAGVARQFVPEVGRVVNCQRAMTLVMTGTVPYAASWRLVMPPSWDDDTARRGRARVPSQQRSRGRADYVLELVDELSLDWHLVPRPVVVGMKHDVGAPLELADALGRRQVPFLIEIADNCVVPLRTGGRSHARSGGRHEVRAVVAAAGSASAPRTTLTVTGPDDQLLRTQVYALPLAPEPNAHPERRLVVEWPFSRNRPTRWWITDIAGGVEDLAALLAEQMSARHAVVELGRRCGLHDYEGRSYGGWNHHVTMSSTALTHLRFSERSESSCTYLGKCSDRSA